MKTPCAYHKCKKTISDDKCLCKAHWDSLPFKLKEKISDAHVNGIDSEDFIEALMDACLWIDNPKEPWESPEG